MALTLAQIQAMITNKEDPRQIINEIADYLQANPGGGAGVASITAGTNVTLGGTATNPIINASGGSSYLSYVALLTQEGTNAPVATVLNGEDANYLGDIEWTRDGEFFVGFYLGTLSGAFTNNKTAVFMQNSVAETVAMLTARNNDNSVFVQTFNGGNSSDDQLINTPIEIRVYP